MAELHPVSKIRAMHLSPCSSITRVLIDTPPFVAPSLLAAIPWAPPDPWPCRWLCPPADWSLPLVLIYRLVIDLPAALQARLHVSADERYELWLDGQRAGCGPERSDEHRWAYESYAVELPAGRHVIEAKVWALGRLAPWAQRSLGPGFLCAADQPALSLLATGVAPWQVRRLDGYEFTSMSEAAGTGIGVGSVETCAGMAAAWRPGQATSHAAEQWITPVSGQPGNSGETMLLGPVRLLVPASLPPQREDAATGLVVCALDERIGGSAWDAPCEPRALSGWQALLSQDRPLDIPARTRVRVLIDTVRYWCGRPELEFTHGAGARIAIAVSEALVHGEPTGEVKGHRDRFVGGRVRQAADVVVASGAPTTWRTLWWRAGRWIEVVIDTAEEPLRLSALRAIRTGYPFAITGNPRDDDAVSARLHDACRDTWQACAHETYLDCPHYEQLMYVGDTRVQALLTYVLTPDARLPRRCLDLFTSGRVVGRGLVPDAYPCGVPKLIPPFSLWWVAMVHDYAWWRAAPPTAWLHGVRDLLDRFLSELDGDGLWPSPLGWNFVDAAEGFAYGTPPGGGEGERSLALQWQVVLALGHWADLEDWHGEPELAARARRHRTRLVAAIEASFWDSARDVYREQVGTTSTRISEHSLILAILSGALSAERELRVASMLFHDQDLIRTTSYFSHYLFEVYGRFQRIDLLLRRLEDWHGSRALGLVTTPEGFGGEGRSDCHAWSAHPLFHRLATILGVRPAAPAFARVRIAPKLGPLSNAAGTVAHPLGTINVEVRVEASMMHADINLPNGLSGEFAWGEVLIPLHEGRQQLCISVRSDG